MVSTIRLAFLFALLILLSCAGSGRPGSLYLPSVDEFRGEIQSGRWMRDIRVDYFDGVKTSSAEMQIYFPNGYRQGSKARTLIALHNTSGDMREWERNTKIEGFANMYGFVIVCPNMGSTIYETKYYPETTRKWNGIPGGKWVGEVLIGYLQRRFSLARDRDRTGIFGASSGARGALLIAATYPSHFSVAGGLSGYYDSVSLPRTALLESVYGSQKSFPERWINDDNIIKLAPALKDTAVFLAHGRDDSHYHYEQSRFLAVKLIMLRTEHTAAAKASQKSSDSIAPAENQAYKFELQLMKREYHNWNFWNYKLPKMMEYFDKHLSRD